MIDFIGYMGTVTLLSTKELFGINLEWFDLFNHIACAVGAVCTVFFTVAAILIYRKYNKMYRMKEANQTYVQYNTI